MTDATSALARGLDGSYRIERPLGEGGMATVFLAHDLKHQRPVALKVLKSELAQSLGPERFRREITTAARLEHPHILGVHDSGETAGLLWFTMPYVRGESLRDRLRREGALPVEEALRIGREAAQALQYAHDEGIVHRDVKPENILLTQDGSTLVADFGIARALDPAARGGTHLTETGAAIGTPQYMAPEQATGQRDVDARADQYALAATLFEMLAGEAPFTAPSAAALVAKRFTSPVPSVRALRPEVPPIVDAALQRALALEPSQRFDSVREFARAASGSLSSAPVVTPTTVATAARPPRTPWRVVGAAAIGLAAAAGAWLALRGRAPQAAVPAASPAGPARLAVLPFENLGDTADAYFADGIADEVRGKLTGVPGLEVIARASSVQYRGSPEPPEQIARELNVRYLLMGTVRWSRQGAGRVRVSPELMEVSPGGAPASKWQQPFDAPLTDLFEMQSGIAAKVANALDVALGAQAQQAIAERPTTDLAAYDAYLRAEAVTNALASADQGARREATNLYRDAVRRDPAFGIAWARLAHALETTYFEVTPTAALRQESESALAQARRHAPNAAATYAARVHFALTILHDGRDALAVAEEGIRQHPNDVALRVAAASTAFALNRTDDGVAHLQRAEAVDPRSFVTIYRLGLAYLRLRRWDAARAELDRALALVPTDLGALQFRAASFLGQGDLAGARRSLAAAPAEVDPDALYAYVANYYDMFWLLDEAQQRRVLQLPVGRFEGDSATWAFVHAQVQWLHGDGAAARAAADSAQRYFTNELAEADDAQLHALRGVSLALLGKQDEAVKEGTRGVAMAPMDRNATTGAYVRMQLARIHALGGDADRAIEVLEDLLAVPCYVSPRWIAIDPNFSSLQRHPRFRALVAAP